MWFQMKRIIKIFLAAVLTLVFLMIAAAVLLIIRSQKSYAEDQLKMPKADEEMLGERFEVPRDGTDSVKVNLYIPGSGKKVPVIFNIHGGAFVAGHADTLDTQSSRISKDWNTAVVTIDYKLAKDSIIIGYGVAEVADTVKYFKEHAAEYNMDADRFVLMGYSAGGYHAMMAALELKKKSMDVAAQVLCYPFIRDAVDVYKTISSGQRGTLAPALFILAGNDPISDGSLVYEEALRSSGVKTEIKKYTGSIHGFLEENNPEYEKLQNRRSKSPEQEAMARDAENFIRDWLNLQFADIGE